MLNVVCSVNSCSFTFSDGSFEVLYGLKSVDPKT